MKAGSQRCRLMCLTGLGTGWLPLVPGTWGSAAAVVLLLPIWYGLAAVGAPRWSVDVLLLAGIGLASHLAVRWGWWAIAHWGRADPRQFTLDELAGQWVALLGAPIALSADASALACVLGGQFLLFRVFDVLKPPPARALEHLPTGWGILADDLAAGLYANLAGQVLWRLTPLAAWLNLPAANG